MTPTIRKIGHFTGLDAGLQARGRRQTVYCVEGITVLPGGVVITDILTAPAGEILCVDRPGWAVIGPRGIGPRGVDVPIVDVNGQVVDTVGGNDAHRGAVVIGSRPAVREPAIEFSIDDETPGAVQVAAVPRPQPQLDLNPLVQREGAVQVEFRLTAGTRCRGIHGSRSLEAQIKAANHPRRTIRPDQDTHSQSGRLQSLMGHTHTRAAR